MSVLDVIDDLPIMDEDDFAELSSAVTEESARRSAIKQGLSGEERGMLDRLTTRIQERTNVSAKDARKMIVDHPCVETKTPSKERKT